MIDKIQKMINAKNEGKCPFCGKDMSNPEFKDYNSELEFKISGLCQECQDDYFKEVK